MENNKKSKEKLTFHPLEELFNIAPGTTVTDIIGIETPMIVHEDYDTKDTEIEEQFQTVYDLALTAYESQVQDIDTIDPRYRARNNEIAIQSLNTALNAAKEKAALKQFKDKLKNAPLKQSGTTTTNNNIIVADRNEMLKAFIEGKLT